MEANHPLSRLVSATDPRSFFAAIQLVEQWLVDQGDSTVAKPLHFYLSRITTKLYGGTGDPCYLSRNLSSNEKDILLRFLRPGGPFFQTLLKLHDRSLLYEIKFDQLPAPTRKAISNLDTNQLPPLYASRLKHEESSRTMGHMIVTPKRGRQPTVKIMFNMFEYYMYSFALCAIQKLAVSSVLGDTQSATGQSPQKGIFSAVPFPKAVSPWAKDGAASASNRTPLSPIYFELVDAYLDFFLPVSSMKDKDEPLTNIASPGTPGGMRGRMEHRGLTTPMRRPLAELTPMRQSLNKAVHNTVEHFWKHEQQSPAQQSRANVLGKVQGTQKDTNVFTTSEIDMSQRRLASEFVVGTFVEVWLCQNDTGALSSPSKLGQSNPGYLKPVESQIICIKSLILQTITVDFYEIYRATADRNRDYIAYEILSARGRAYQIVRPKLYWFFRCAFDYWPRDDSFISVVELWLAYIMPWKRQNPDAKYNDRWIQFVHDNFMFYTILLGKFLHRAKEFDIFSSVRPVSGASGTKTLVKPYLKILEMVFKSFDDETLLSVLRAIETAISSLDNRMQYGTRFHARDLGGVYDGTEAHSKVLQTLLNSGHESRTKLSQIGERQESKPVFLISNATASPRKAESLNVTDEVTMILSNLLHSRERLHALLEGGPSRRSSATSPTTGRRTSQYFLSTGSEHQPTEQTECFKLSPFPSADPSVSSLLRWLGSCLLVVLILTITTAFRSARKAIGYVQRELNDDGRRHSDGLTNANQEIIKENIKRLDKCADDIIAVWDGKIPKPEARPPSGRGLMNMLSPGASRRTSTVDPSSLRGGDDRDRLPVAEEEEVVFKTVLPGVLAPEEIVRRDGVAVLTQRGRQQLKEGLRMSAKTDIPILPSDRAGDLVMTYEFASLVRFWKWVAGVLDDEYAELRHKHPQLPQLPSFIWLRHFAAWQNIAFWILASVVSCYGLKVTWLILKAIFSGGPPSQPLVRAQHGANYQRPQGGMRNQYGVQRNHP
ncbi:uncharacterized protein EV422DRAFT_534441 [Fimicolochytrium jonesii]|uniref:uncharacterized protein n=1 Tax=Fimicolochytrium jonesii TaxID=1396493 RepID=UPI0022FE1BE4|nr:uncharacterized protein EV422DRAFT_534441 [Fimicolochytrium jonesii]KAI8819360.1 hypothetical protein EV422DRAFT_534441 [Fimicolochytrium jonesii]